MHDAIRIEQISVYVGPRSLSALVAGLRSTATRI
jgi:hypothetical protein